MAVRGTQHAALFDTLQDQPFVDDMDDCENQYSIQLRAGTGEVIDCQITLEEEAETDSECFLTLSIQNELFRASAADYFDAFCRIRIELQRHNLLPLCYGASRNVYPSGMGRDMGRGLRAYKMTLGQRGKLSDLVFIFASGEDIEPVTVAEQEEFVRQWHASLPQPTPERLREIAAEAEAKRWRK